MQKRKAVKIVFLHKGKRTLLFTGVNHFKNTLLIINAILNVGLLFEYTISTFLVEDTTFSRLVNV